MKPRSLDVSGLTQPHLGDPAGGDQPLACVRVAHYTMADGSLEALHDGHRWNFMYQHWPKKSWQDTMLINPCLELPESPDLSTTDSHAFSFVCVYWTTAVSLRVQLKDFPRLFTCFSDTNGIWTPRKQKWHLSDTLPFLRTKVLDWLAWNSFLPIYWAFPALGGAIIILTLMFLWQSGHQFRLWLEVDVCHIWMRSPTFHFCWRDKYVHRQGKQGHWYGTPRGDVFH